MKLFGVCPICNHELPIRLKDKVVCENCGKMLAADERVASAICISILAFGYASYLVDWRLSLFVCTALSIVGLKVIKYREVRE